MKMIYIAGPYTTGDTKANIEHAKRATMEFLESGYAVFCPHTCYAGMEENEDLEYSDFLAADFEILSRCDVIFMLEGWNQSPGACAELVFAERNGIEVLYE